MEWDDSTKPGSFVSRTAFGTISNVQINNCGQFQQPKGIINISNIDATATASSTPTLSILNSVFMNSDTIGVNFLNAGNIDFENNVILNTVQIGMNVKDLNNSIINNNIIMFTKKYQLDASVSMTTIIQAN